MAKVDSIGQHLIVLDRDGLCGNWEMLAKFGDFAADTVKHRLVS